MRYALSGLFAVHGLIHLLGFAKAFGFVELPQLTQPISRPLGLLWLAAALLMLACAFSLARDFWMLGSLALVISQATIFTAFRDAGYGTLPNLVLFGAVVYGFASHGPYSFRAEYLRDVASELHRASTPSVLTEADLAPLPLPVQRYLRLTGSLGQPRISNFRARWSGRMRAAENEPWMAFSADQHNTFSTPHSRLFSMSATMRGLPVDVYHRFVGEAASFRVRLLSLFTMVDAKGEALDRAETVTIFNDLCILAPANLVDASVRWERSDAHSAHAVYTRGAHTIRAELLFNELGELVDFISDDRLRSSPDGKSFTRVRFTTPVSDYRSFGARRISTHGQAKWHPAEGSFAYGEFELLEIAYNVR